jgi:hypothetical protein
MLNIAIRNKSIIAICVLFIALSFMNATASAQTYLHKVVKGDTLWSICEKYYGDSFLWPKLWQMNPFITNPHLLEPGDLINLLEGVPITTGAKPLIKPSEPVSGTTLEPITPTPIAPPVAKKSTPGKGIDISSYADVKTLGYLSRSPVQPWGRIYFKSADKILLEEGELAVVQFFQTEGLRIGQEFVIYRTDPVKDPITQKDAGQSIEILGKLVLKKALEKGFYSMLITKLYREININDVFMPVEPISPCVLPISSDIEIVAHIITSKDLKQLIGLRSVVYIDQGFNQGIQRGQMYNIINNVAGVVELSLGKIIIIESRPDTSIGIVLQMESRESGNGVIIKSIAWDEPPEFLKRLTACWIQ